MVSTSGDGLNREQQAGTSVSSEPKDYLNIDRSILSWVFTLDHKRIALMYLISSVFFMIAAGLIALLIRFELLYPAGKYLTDDWYNRLFTIHGAMMLFLFIIPVIPATLGNFLLPLMLGAKALAFPRLNLLSFHLYSFGAIVILASILAGGLDTGWTLYAPYSTHISPFSNALMYGVFGILILSFSYILMAINFIATIHNMRIKGLTWTRLPLFVWTLYAASFVKLLATPVLTLTTVLILLERIFQIGIFNPAQGGDPSLFQHFFWFYAQPAQYIALLSAFGLISEMLSVHSRKPIFGYLPFVASSALVALLCFFIWGHQMPVSGQSHLTNVLFSLFSLLLILPIVFMLFSWLATLYGGVIRLNTPMLYTLSAILMLAIGISANFITGAITLNAFLHNTYFATAQLHYLLMGTATVALIGGIYHWWPKISGRMYCELWGRIGAIAVFVGFNITFFAKFLLGIYGMPQRYHTYAQLSSELTHTYHLYHSISTYGSWLLALGIAIAVMTPILSLRNAKDAPANPWAASTLEWQTQSPPTSLNFDEPLDEVRHEPYQYAQLDQSAAKGQS